jgi:uncharacterized protein YdeI (YjbR/CyaY-like superfamily)
MHSAESDILFFEDQWAFRQWLEVNHTTAKALQVGFYKVGSGKKSMSWSESVDQALCFGWIDGIRKSLDAESYTIRFTPRKKNSIWSAVNNRKVEVLLAANLMKPAGLEAFSYKNDERSRVYSYENALEELMPVFEKKFKEDTKAWAFFQAQAPSYRKQLIHWVMSAKQEKTQSNRLQQLIAACRKKERLR